ncbi:MAG: ketopantoate reductase family protein, partial [Alphaproteobacteria bacterium]
NLLETLLDKIVNDVGPTAINTVLQDHMKGRYSEIDMINGLVSTESKKHGKNTPVTDIIVDLTHQIHSGDLKPNKQNLELINRRLLSPG